MHYLNNGIRGPCDQHDSRDLESQIFLCDPICCNEVCGGSADLAGVDSEGGLCRGAGALGHAECANLAHQLLQSPELDVALHDLGAMLVAQLPHASKHEWISADKLLPLFCRCLLPEAESEVTGSESHDLSL